jgi:hypothetical protein
LLLFAFVIVFVIVAQFAASGRSLVELAIGAFLGAFFAAVFRASDVAATATKRFGVGSIDLDMLAAQGGALDEITVAALLGVFFAGVLGVLGESFAASEAELLPFEANGNRIHGSFHDWSRINPWASGSVFGIIPAATAT